MKVEGKSSRPKDSKKVNGKGRNGEPVTLYPLSPEEAMRRLLNVPHEPQVKKSSKQKEVGR